MDYYVYQIVFKNEIVYYGRTNDITRREKEHRKAFDRGDIKELYNYLRSKGANSKDIVLDVIYESKSKADSKRYEIYCILTKWMKNDKLYQKIPSISDR